ncbi:MAG: MEDS domain-containing protein [Deltaproteobacteria bacterium]|nr:MEDS domain-containing protein [Deltaproteobacteria bacterium]
MADQATALDIDLLGKPPWGTHICQFYRTKEDLADILVPYFKAGLENNELCVWITGGTLSVEDAETALREAVENLDDYIEKDQMEIIDYRQWYTRSGRFDAQEVLQHWVEKEHNALRRGFNGIRVTDNTSWLDETTWRDFMNYEAAVDNAIGAQHMIAICSYPLEKCGPAEIADVVSVHSSALFKRRGNWGLIESVPAKRKGAALRKTEERLTGILNSVTDCISVIDETLTLVWVNDVATRPFGPDLIGKKCYSAYRGRDKVCECCIVKKCFEDGKTRHQEKEVIDIDGNTTVLWSTASVAARHEDGRPKAVVQVSRDITKQKQDEEEKEKIRAQLRQAQKMEAIGTLAGGIAHDFNNILSAIIGYAQLALNDAPKDTELRDDIEEVLQASHRATDLVKHILAFSRQSEQERKPILISPVIKEVLNLLRASLPSTIDIRQQIETGPMIVEADPSQIHQVMMNLCTNSGYAMRDEGGTLEVSLTKMDLDAAAAASIPEFNPGPCVRLTVSDTGHGMNHEVVEQVFNPYYSTKEKGEGTGLGLSMVHGIVKSYGGAITIQSESGKGSTFHVYFPRVEKETAATPEKAEPLPSGHERILFVDDEQALVVLGKHMLERLGYEVVTRTSSIEALELFHAKPDHFDLVISDMTMPNMTGDKLAKELIRIRSDIPIIICTGYSERVTEDSIGEMGIRELVMKPLAMHVLAETVRSALDKN